MKTCNGPCHQGRLMCPTPDACEQEDESFENSGKRLLDFVVATCLAAFALAFALGVSVLVLQP